MTRYKDPSRQSLFDTMLLLAQNPKSELYHNGKPRGGANVRVAFWRGVDGVPYPPARGTPGSLVSVCYQAGREFARRQKRAAKAPPPVEG